MKLIAYPLEFAKLSENLEASTRDSSFPAIITSRALLDTKVNNSKLSTSPALEVKMVTRVLNGPASTANSIWRHILYA